MGQPDLNPCPSGVIAVPRFFGSLLLCIAMTSVAAADEFPQLFNTQELTTPLLAPDVALARITVPPGFHVSLFAAEPDVQQPIAIATDERGRLWVAENYTYAEREANFESKLHDRIIILEDADGDGRFDKRTVFWDQASKLASVEVGFGGVWALCAPNLLFIPDRNHDDVPDGEPVVVLNGWNDDSIRHNIVNGLRWGPDGWLYGRHGIAGTSLVGTPETGPEFRTPMDCSIWRYHPTRRVFEVVARGTTNPWGMDWDDHGQMFFINTVIGHLWHVIPGAYYQRMYGEHFDSNVYQLLPQTADHYHWDTAEQWHEIRNLGVTPTTDKAGGGHAHCGMMIYLGDNWPAKYRGQVFTWNLHGLRVNCDRLERAGATYVGKHEPDFLKSTDPWFRGLELAYGPDGGVYIADWSDIGECHENDGIHRTSGRIYKVTYGKSRKVDGDMTQLDAVGLVALQLHSNDWFVRQSRRLLQERAAAGEDLAGARRELQRIFLEHPDEMRKLRALWALYVTGSLGESFLVEQLKHPSEHVRVWSIQMLVDQGEPTLAARQALTELARTEESGLVLTFLASSLYRTAAEDRWPLAKILAQKAQLANDPVYPLMVWYGVEPAVTGFAVDSLQLLATSRLPLLRQLVARRLTSEINHQPAATAELVRLLADPQLISGRIDILEGMAAALRGWSKATPPTSWPAVQAALSKSDDPRIVELTRELAVVFGDGRALDELRGIVSNGQAELASRRAAIQSLVAARDTALVPLLQKLLGDRDLSVDAIRGLAAYENAETPKLLVERFASLQRQPARQEAIATLASRAAYSRILLDAVAAGKIPREELSPFQLRQMRSLGQPEIDRRIAELWPELQQLSSEKLQRIAALRTSLPPEVLATANVSAGRALFKQSCANCHRLFGEGGKVGPDLTGAQRNNLNYLLENIVDPSATVSKDFHLSILLLDDGRVLSGIVIGQDENTVTLQGLTERFIIPRDEIEETRPSNLSMMPERQLDVMQPDQVRDLIGYLMSPSQVPLPNLTDNGR